MYGLDFSILSENYKTIFAGISMTVLVSSIASVIAFVLGTFFVYFRISPNESVQKIMDFLVSCIRNMPLLILIYLFYKGLPSIGIVFSAFVCGVLALGIYTAAYISDALLSGIYAVPKEHFQASKALGLTRIQSFLYIIYPQALRHCVFILGSQFMNLIKNSSLVSFIAVADTFYVVYKGMADSYRIYEYFILAVVVYGSLTLFVLLVTNILQKNYKLPAAEVRV
ncbi:MAG: amino acid ABC transporter permease [Candidatus Gastranaerophilales bacterium]|nr:amino acid ABC transporter permease [Candidatus Gastranaerophilales bacterium]